MRKRVPIGLPVADRLALLSHETDSGCVVWDGTLRRDGYGVIRLNKATQRVHRVSWELVNGPVPDGYELDHLCHNRRCISVGHLRMASRVENGQNLAGAHVDSRTGVRGVYVSRGKYVGRVCARGVNHRAGSFDTLEEARMAVEDLRAKLHEPIPEAS